MTVYVDSYYYPHLLVFKNSKGRYCYIFDADGLLYYFRQENDRTLVYTLQGAIFSKENGILIEIEDDKHLDNVYNSKLLEDLLNLGYHQSLPQCQ